ncbi:MAG: hypothetical protein LBJ08_01715, partial [Bifidobacteriaceae bacterium]|nr:hypothetical protein [Bifidobacteriaceae bacterium]
MNDAKGWDAETNPLNSLTVSAAVNVRFVGFIHSGRDNWWYPSSTWAGGSKLMPEYTQVAPYGTDPDYAIITFTLYESVVYNNTHVAIPSTRNDFSVKVKKWERQYPPEVTTPKWFGANFFLSSFGAERVTWSPIPGQPHHWEVRAATGVTFPYALSVRAA